MILTIQWVVAYLVSEPSFLFLTVQYQKDSFLDAFMLLIFKLVHFIQYKPRKSVKNGYSTKNVQNTGLKFSQDKRSHYLYWEERDTLYQAIYMLPLFKYFHGFVVWCIQTMHSNEKCM